MTISYEENYLELPSFTFCPQEKNRHINQTDMTFQDYMNQSLKVTDLLTSAKYFVFLPGKK